MRRDSFWEPNSYKEAKYPPAEIRNEFVEEYRTTGEYCLGFLKLIEKCLEKVELNEKQSRRRDAGKMPFFQ